VQAFQGRAGELAHLYETREFGKVMREVMALADSANDGSTRAAMGARQAGGADQHGNCTRSAAWRSTCSGC